MLARAWDAGSRHLGHQADDIWGLGFIVAGSLSALGLYFNSAGPFGDGLTLVTGTLLGLGRFLLPVALWMAGGVLLRERSDGDPGRVAIGLILASLGGVGLAHVARNSPELGGDVELLRDAGGIVGGMLGQPLEAAMGEWGAALVLAAMLVIGVLVAVKLSLRRVLNVTHDGVAYAGRGAATGLKKLGQLSSGNPDNGPDAETGTAQGSVLQINDSAEIDLTDDDDSSDADGQAFEEPDTEAGADVGPRAARSVSRLSSVPSKGEQLEIALGPAARPGQWKLPPQNSLDRSTATPVDRRLIEDGGRTLEATLAEFGVQARLVGMTVGPTVTRYELELASGVKVNRVTGLSHDIAYALASPDVRIIAPIPGRSAVGVEVPNRQRRLVTLGDVLVSPEMRDAIHPLEVGLGRDISGKAVALNLATMPHLLIAGATGAGKSSCINSIITSVLMRATPDQVRLILVDPKRVELGVYNGLPHLLTEVVIDPKKAANALSWAVREMEMRYGMLAEVGVRDITGYNAAFDRGDLTPQPSGSYEDDPEDHSDDGDDDGADRGRETGAKSYERLPYILIVVDELNDLMMVAARDVETSICRIAQMARAVGIHLVIATQRPSVDVITGVIKANIPSRLAFATSSIADSRVILDVQGAEKLIGQGDMLLAAASSSGTQRVQGAWVEEREVHKVVAHWRRQITELQYVEGLADAGPGGSGAGGDANGVGDGDDLLEEAMELVVRSKIGSTSMLQRKLRVGFSRAGRLMDLLERQGVVGPSEGSKARAVLMTIEELEQRDARAS